MRPLAAAVAMDFKPIAAATVRQRLALRQQPPPYACAARSVVDAK